MLLNKDRALEIMERHQLDALVGALHENFIYLTDTEGQLYLSHYVERDPLRDFFAILPRSQDVPATIIGAPSLFSYLVDQPTWMPEVRVYGEGGARAMEGAELGENDRAFLRLQEEAERRRLPAPPARALATALLEMGLAARPGMGASSPRVGVDDMRVALQVRESGLADIEWIDASEIFREIRAVKTVEEQERLRIAVAHNQKALEAVFQSARPGMSWRELKLLYDKTLLELGSWPRCWAVGGGPRPYRHNLHQPDAPGPSHVLQVGDIVRIDAEGTYKHYWADIHWLGILGAPVPESYSRAMEALRAARDGFRPLLRPGTPLREIVRVGSETASRFNVAGFRRLFGHGVGLQWYEWPEVSESSEHVLEAGMVVNIEGGPSLVGWGGLNLEDTYLITATGFEAWTAGSDRVWELAG